VNRRKESPGLVPDVSIAIGQLIVKLRDAGLFSDDDVQTVLRTALASAAPTISAVVPSRGAIAADWWQGHLAAE